MENAEVMQAFLLWLGDDPSFGAQQYEEVRRKLILLFRWRGCYIPEELADETMDRTARAVLKPGFQYTGDKMLYFRAVARNVFLEWTRRERKMPKDSLSDTPFDLPASSPAQPAEDVRHECLEKCLQTLPASRRTLVIRYYRSDKREKIDERQLLAEEMGIGLNALRIQVFRTRNALRTCVARCEEQGETVCPEEA
jgi:DNA-directed RNA polymerase specialized sigma24 family protein